MYIIKYGFPENNCILDVCNNTRLCGITMEWFNNKCLILNAYMPYDVGYDDGNSLLEYINVMHEVKLLIDTHNPTHIIYAGDH